MKTIFTTLLLFTLAPASILIDFGTKGNADNWYIINDSVMGGVSWGNKSFSKSSMIFKGELSTENNGGFASIRSKVESQDLSKYEKVSITYRTNVKEFFFQLENSRVFFLPCYRFELINTYNKWNTVEIPLRSIKEYQMFDPTGNKTTTNTLENIIRIGFILLTKEEGDFVLEVDKIEFS